MGKKLISILAAFLLGSQVFCGSLSFQIVQHNDSMTEVSQSVLAVEDEILNYFFAQGFIVSNENAAVSKSEENDKALWKSGFNNAIDGSLDNFAQIRLYVNQNETDTEKVGLGMIDKVSWKVMSVKTGKVLEESSKVIEKPLGNDSVENVTDFASDFAYHLMKIVNNRK